MTNDLVTDPASTEAQSATAEQLSSPKRVPGALWIALCVILATAAVVFMPVRGFELLMWDDAENITHNPMVAQPTAESLKRIWAQPYDGLYIPLTYTSWWLQSRFGGSPGAYHVANLALHLANTIAVFCFLAMCALTVVKNASERTAMLFGVVAGTALFALHPLQTESIAWATGRKDLLSGFFVLASLCAYAGWRITGRLIAYVGAVALFLLALLAKPSAVALPLAVIVLDVWIFRTAIRRVATAAAPMLAVALIMSLITARAQRSAGSDGPITSVNAVPAWKRPAVAADAVRFYAQKTAAPVGLSPVYAIRGIDSANSARSLIALAILVPVVILLLARRSPMRGALLISLAFLLPVSGIIPFHYQRISFVADRYMYPAFAGIALALALLIAAVGARSRAALSACGAVSICALCACAWMSRVQCLKWKDSLTLWSHAVSVAPGSAVAQSNYAMSLAASNQPQEAIARLEQAVRLDPEFAVARNNLGDAYMQMGKLPEALAEFDAAAHANPKLAQSQMGIATVAFQMNMADRAEQAARKSLELAPNNFPGLAVLASVLGNRGEVATALELLRAAAKSKPDDPQIAQLLKQAESLAGGAAASPSVAN